ncbi:MAG: isocitrate/isopropylmalate family dehydrogenase, partial [Acidobacteriota bacterium]
MSREDFYKAPADGQEIGYENGQVQIPDRPIVPFIEGDGIGPDIWRATQRVLDAAVDKAESGKSIAWMEVLAGEKAQEHTGEWLPQQTFDAVRHYRGSIKGPLTTPVGGGFRSLNVTLRQKLDLYACVRPVKWYQGVPSPVREPEHVDMVLFRENTEDVYSGVEFVSGSDEAAKLVNFLKDELGKEIRPDSGIGIKPISPTGTKNLVRKAIQYAIDQGRSSVTLVHKGNIMKFTEGSFKDWGYELAREEFGDATISEDDVWRDHGGKAPEGKVMIKDRIADAMFQQVLLRPAEYEVVAVEVHGGEHL